MSFDFQINKNWAGLLQSKVYINSGTKIHDIAFATQIKKLFGIFSRKVVYITTHGKVVYAYFFEKNLIFPDIVLD